MITFTSWDYELYHFGIRGQKWGRRRYQNEDGSLTEEGKRRYGTKENYDRLVNRKKPKYMTDEELERNTRRLEAENRYKELQRKNSGVEALTNLVSKIGEAQKEKNKQALDEKRLEVQKLQAITNVQKAREERKQAKEERKKVQKERRKSLTEHRQNRKDARVKLRNAIKQSLSKIMDKEGTANKETAKKIADMKSTLTLKELSRKIRDFDLEEPDAAYTPKHGKKS